MICASGNGMGRAYYIFPANIYTKSRLQNHSIKSPNQSVEYKTKEKKIKNQNSNISKKIVFSNSGICHNLALILAR